MNWDWSYLYTNFNGRITRSEYWGATLLLIIPILIVQYIAFKIAGPVAATIVSLIFYYPGYAVAVKRTNDRNRPAWIIQLFFAILIIFNLLVAIAGSPVPPSIGWQNMGSLIVFIFSLYLFVEVGCLRGTVGDNQYGPDPLAEPAQQA